MGSDFLTDIKATEQGPHHDEYNKICNSHAMIILTIKELSKKLNPY